jgi:hypothetical protein
VELETADRPLERGEQFIGVLLVEEVREDDVFSAHPQELTHEVILL